MSARPSVPWLVVVNQGNDPGVTGLPGNADHNYVGGVSQFNALPNVRTWSHHRLLCCIMQSNRALVTFVAFTVGIAHAASADNLLTISDVEKLTFPVGVRCGYSRLNSNEV
ncbi:hypothetical protein B0H19DRAFT_1255529 [Mycena capillaripes]|nr:hypothetical protein B0H19DRAFT_1255529 [Mycena capillaripes]